ncbi:hypothetical protein Agub_g14260, partial [Astrephomene gubernaculifera]
VAARATSHVHERVVETLKDMIRSGAFPGLHSVRCEVLLEPEMMSVDIIAHMTVAPRQEPHPTGHMAAGRQESGAYLGATASSGSSSSGAVVAELTGRAVGAEGAGKEGEQQ